MPEAQNQVHQSGDAELQTPEEGLQYPESVTLSWLYTHLPIKIWGVLGSLILTAVFIGIQIGDINTVRQLLGKRPVYFEPVKAHR